MFLMNRLGRIVGEGAAKYTHIKALESRINKIQSLDTQGAYKQADKIVEEVINMCPTWLSANELETYIRIERGFNLKEKRAYREALKNFERAYSEAFAPEIADQVAEEIQEIKRLM